jgi:uncharacterized protein DUF3822
VPLPFSHFDKRYQPSQDRTWHVSLWTSPGLKGWCVHDIRSNACVGLTAATGDPLPHADRLPKHPASVSFIAVPEISTLVPEGVLESGREAAHLELVHGPLPTGRLRDEPIDALSARCIFLHDEGAERKLLERFPGARPVALQALLIKSALALVGEKPLLLVHRGEERCDLVIARDGRILLANSFFAPAGTDVLYYALFALDRTGLRPGDVQALTCGHALITQEQDLLEQYFAGSAPALAPADASIAGLAITDPHRWFTLLQQWACVS